MSVAASNVGNGNGDGDGGGSGGGALLEVDDIQTYYGSIQALKGVTLSVEEEEPA